ncbi:hypothetical protein EPO14_01130 [Patescibacteria group bacterium]|nr:MAG: hypothetical protein EPO14_01130 [Patescibacteria group bacterium]
MRIFKVEDAADGSATPGAVFTASINQKAIPVLGTTLNYLKLSLKGAVSTAAVAIETFALLLSGLVLRKGADNRIVLFGDELVALSVFLYGETPAIGENTDATGNNFLGNIKIPINDKFDQNAQFLYQLDRAAQTNIATETLSLTAYSDVEPDGKKPIHAVRIPHTTAGTAGIEQFQPRIPSVGTLKAIMIKVPNGFADGNIDTSVQRLKLLSGGQEIASWNDLTDAKTLIDNMDYVTPSPLADLLRPFRVFELGENGIDAKTNELSIAFDVQDVSDAIVVIPILEIA